MSVVDQKVRVSSMDAARMCSILARYGIFAGQSSGAYLHGVYETAKRIEKGVIVTLLNDIGERYMSTGLWEARRAGYWEERAQPAQGWGSSTLGPPPAV